MNETELRVLQALLAGPQRLSSLAKAIGKSRPRTSASIKLLIKKGIVIKPSHRAEVRLAETPRAALLSRIVERFNLTKLLKGPNEVVLLSLDRAKTLSEIKAATELSSSQIYKSLATLQEIGAVKRTAGAYKIAAIDVARYVQLTREEALAAKPTIRILFSDKDQIEKALPSQPVDGELTAFSRFAEFGIEFYTTHSYYYLPKRSLAVDEIFAHALLAAEDKKQLAMCLVFYLKNKAKLDAKKIEGLAKHFNVLSRWLDVLAYLDKRPVKNAELFLPWAEFKAKAALYKIKVLDKFPGAELETELQRVGAALDKELELYMIGGGNFILQGLKDSTKDLDIVVKSKTDFSTLIEGLSAAGYKELLPIETAYKKLFPSVMMGLPGRPRWDVFVRVVCRALQLDEHMLGRAKLYKKLGKLSLYLIAFEDIFLFKAITEREGDLEDAALIATKGLANWKTVLAELIEQERLAARLFSIDVLDTVELLEDRYNIKIPIRPKLQRYALQQVLLLLLKKGPQNIKQLKSTVEFPEYQLYNALKSLQKSGKIKVFRKAGLNYYQLRK